MFLLWKCVTTKTSSDSLPLPSKIDCLSITTFYLRYFMKMHDKLFIIIIKLVGFIAHPFQDCINTVLSSLPISFNFSLICSFFRFSSSLKSPDTSQEALFGYARSICDSFSSIFPASPHICGIFQQVLHLLRLMSCSCPIKS